MVRRRRVQKGAYKNKNTYGEYEDVALKTKTPMYGELKKVTFFTYCEANEQKTEKKPTVK